MLNRSIPHLAFAALLCGCPLMHTDPEPIDGCGGNVTATPTHEGGSGGVAPLACAEWDYPAGEPFARECREESARCGHASFGAEIVPVCCPADEPCAPPATGTGRCDPMLGTFLGWCCLPDCD